MKIMKLFAVALVAGMFMVGCEAKKEEIVVAPVEANVTEENVTQEANTTL